jgi:hypothetical protein
MKDMEKEIREALFTIQNIQTRVGRGTTRFNGAGFREEFVMTPWGADDMKTGLQKAISILDRIYQEVRTPVEWED